MKYVSYVGALIMFILSFILLKLMFDAGYHYDLDRIIKLSVVGESYYIILSFSYR